MTHARSSKVRRAVAGGEPATTPEERARFDLIVAEVDRYNSEDFSETLWNRLDDVREIAGYPLINYGGARLVFGLDAERVLKVGYDTWEGEESQNLNEIQAWSDASRGTRKYLAPVLDWSTNGRWLVMSRTEPVSRVPSATAAALRRITGDVGVKNVGRLGDRIVLHDYGLPEDEGWG